MLKVRYKNGVLEATRDDVNKQRVVFDAIGIMFEEIETFTFISRLLALDHVTLEINERVVRNEQGVRETRIEFNIMKRTPDMVAYSLTGTHVLREDHPNRVHVGNFKLEECLSILRELDYLIEEMGIVTDTPILDMVELNYMINESERDMSSKPTIISSFDTGSYELDVYIASDSGNYGLTKIHTAKSEHEARVYFEDHIRKLPELGKLISQTSYQIFSHVIHPEKVHVYPYIRSEITVNEENLERVLQSTLRYIRKYPLDVAMEKLYSILLKYEYAFDSSDENPITNISKQLTLMMIKIWDYRSFDSMLDAIVDCCDNIELEDETGSIILKDHFIIPKVSDDEVWKFLGKMRSKETNLKIV